MFPTFHQAKNQWPDAQDAPQRLTPKQWHDILTTLGFELWESAQGSTIENRVRERFEEKDMERWKPGQAGLRPRRSIPHDHRVEFWQHPLGALAALDMYRPPNKEQWSLNDVHVLAFQNLGLVQETKSALESYGVAGTNGSLMSDIRWSARSSNDGEQSFAMLCDLLEKARADGKIVPPSHWDTYADRIQTGLFNPIKTWLGIRGDWGNLAFRVPKETHPAKQTQTVSMLFRQRAPALKKLVEESLNPKHGATGLKKAWIRSIEELGSKPTLPQGKELDLLREERHQRNRSDQLFFALVGLDGDGVLAKATILTPEQSTTLEIWNLAAAESVCAKKACEQVPFRFPGAPHWTVIDAWTLFPMQPGIWEKIETKLNSVSDEELTGLTQGRGASVPPLALALARGLLSISNNSQPQSELDESLRGALACLDLLYERLGPEGIVWEGVRENVWGMALNLHLFLEGNASDDLVAIQQPRFRALFEWGREKGLAFPSTVRWNNDGMDLERSLLDGSALNDATRDLDTLPEKHWELLRSAQLVLRHEALERSLPQAPKGTRVRM